MFVVESVEWSAESAVVVEVSYITNLNVSPAKIGRE